MNERRQQVFVRSAERRLRNASDVYRRSGAQLYDDALLDMADVAMLVWSAGIDIVSALMLLAAESRLGSSSRRRRYVREQLDTAHPNLRLLAYWLSLARLHNFQHNLDMSQAQFQLDCRLSGMLIKGLNGLLPMDLRLPPNAYAWLAEVGQASNRSPSDLP